MAAKLTPVFAGHSIAVPGLREFFTVSRNVDKAVAAERSRLAVLGRRRPEDRAAIAETRRNLAAAKLRAHVQKIVAEAPPLTSAQISAIVDVLVDGRRADISASARGQVARDA